MSINEIRQIEENREGALNVVHLELEGNFYHANDWSAWLMTKYPIGEAVNKPMTVTAKKLKDGYIQAFVGFPAKSMTKYIPNDGSVEFTSVTDTLVDVTLPIDFGDTPAEDIRKEVDAWKESLKLSETKKQKREDREIQTQAPRITRFSDIIGRIIAIQMEDISPQQAYDILRDLRKQTVALF